MTFFLIVFGGMIAFATIVGTVDLIGRRRQRNASER
jgi:hypothetical protein